MGSTWCWVAYLGLIAVLFLLFAPKRLSIKRSALLSRMLTLSSSSSVVVMVCIGKYERLCILSCFWLVSAR